MTWKRISRALTLGILSTVVVAHLLFVVSLVGFGLRSDGWVLHPIGIAWYGLCVVGGAGALFYVLRTTGGTAWLPVIPAVLTLVVVGAYPATSLLGGARYAPYDTGDIHEWFVNMNLIAGLAMAALALLYRRPRLLLRWAVAQGILLITYPAWWGGLWRWGALGNGLPALVLAVGLPLLYGLTANVLGVGLPKRWTRRLVAGLGIGVILVAVAGLRHQAYLNTQNFNQGARAEMTWGFGFVLGIPVLVAFGGLLAPLPLQAARMLRERTTDETRRFPWEILALVIVATTPVLTRFMQPTPDTPEGIVPAAGQVQAWRSPDHVVPDAWLPTLRGAGWLLQAARWLLIPYVLVNLGSALRRWDECLRNVGATLRKLVTFPHALLGAGLLWVAVSAWDAGRMGFPLRIASGVWSRSAGYPYPVVPTALLLLLAGRALENAEGGWRRWTWRWLSAGGLLRMVVWAGRRAWRYGRILIAPLPAWTAAEPWQYAPLPRIPLSALGLALHLVLLSFGLWSLSRWARAVLPLKRRGRLSHSKLLPIVVPLLALIALTGLGWWITTPRVVATVPTNGATGVPREVMVSIQMQERAWLWRQLNGGGFGISAHYADTGAYIPSMSGGSSSSLRLDPESPLRPGATVEVTVHRAGERPYTLRFTTAAAPPSQASQ